MAPRVVRAGSRDAGEGTRVRQAGSASLIAAPDAARREARRAEAKAHFDGPVHLAAPGLVHDLT
ncbi:hypothetical protein [Nonomuraea rosea]